MLDVTTGGDSTAAQRSRPHAILRLVRGGVYGGAWSGPVFVLTHHAPDDEEDATNTFLSDDIRSAVATALRAADGKDLLVLGACIAPTRSRIL